MATQRGKHHRRGTADAALYLNGIDGAVQLAGSAFHASLCIDKISQPALHLERAVRTDIRADPASDAGGLIILKCVGLVGIEHGNSG